MSELKPCPFCGTEARTMYVEDLGEWIAFCYYCGCTMEYYDSEESVIKAWNRRVQYVEVLER